jgi:hypothetical protein
MRIQHIRSLVIVTQSTCAGVLSNFICLPGNHRQVTENATFQALFRTSVQQCVALPVRRCAPAIIFALPRPFRWFHIVLMVIGGITTIIGLGWLALYAFFIYPFSHFTDGNCSPDTEQRLVNAPNGGAGAATAAWEGPNRIAITYPKSAKVVDAYAKSFGIDIVLRPK